MDVLRPRSSQEWRLIRSERGPGALNMSVDEALVESVRAGAPPTLRFYGWSPPALSLGRNQPARGQYDSGALRRMGIDVVRRPTGGRAVLHDAELTYSVVVPDRMLGSARLAFERINVVLASGLASLGAAVSVASATGAPLPVPSTVPCFAQPVPGELLAAGRKLVGSAQVRIRGVLLQHGSIPLRRSPHVEAVFGFGGPVSDDEPAYVEDAIGRGVTTAEVTDALGAAWSESMGRLHEEELRPMEHCAAARLMAKYEADRWTWRA